MADLLPTAAQRDALCRLFHHIFVQIRFSGYSGRCEQMTDLADAAHNLPLEMIGDADFFVGDGTLGFGQLSEEALRKSFEARSGGGA